MLSGSAGDYSLTSYNEPPRDNFGEKTIAAGCFVVVLPHYLEAIGRKSLSRRQTIIADFPLLFMITDELLRRAKAMPSVRGQPVFLFGQSLGGYLSVALAFHDHDVLAVSEISGGIPAGYVPPHPHPLAVLISHGIDDQIVSIQAARKLYGYCHKHHLEVKMDLYPGTGHYFTPTQQFECARQTAQFFQTIQHDHAGDE